MEYKKNYDVIVIGGGATGCGVALDASLRGLSCLVVEKNDFAEGTSSRSTKLVHGGVRYLEAAVKKLSLAQYNLVKEGLKERYRLLNNAPHLAKPLTLITPLYKWHEIPYMYAGLALYDLISGKRRLGRSQIVSKKEILDIFPYVKQEGLKGGVRYFDGTFNDSRMSIALLQSAKKEGCDIKNYAEVTEFIYGDTKIIGVKLKDKITNKSHSVNATCIVNATGPFSDNIRKLDNKNAQTTVHVSSGVHIVLDKKFLPNDEGIMIPKTEDGRVLFMLPYLGKCLVGTTDKVAKVTEHPKVVNSDIEYLLRHIKKYFSVEVKKSDILSSWSGLRPLVEQKNTKSTKELVREHLISKSKSGLISIVGGKWTTYRKMAEEVVDMVEKRINNTNLHICKTKSFKLVGSRENIVGIKEKLDRLYFGEKIKKHLLCTYGDKSLKVVEYIDKYGEKKLHIDYPYLEAEIYYSIENEFVKKPLDFLLRRINIGLIDKKACVLMIGAVTDILQNEFKWSIQEGEFELKNAKELLAEAI